MTYTAPTRCNKCRNRDSGLHNSHRLDYEGQELMYDHQTATVPSYTPGYMVATCNNCGHKQVLQP